MTAGPTRNAAYPKVTTTASNRPPPACPAAAYTCGAIIPTPSPTSAQPASTTGSGVAVSTTRYPATATAPPNRTTRRRPNAATARSPQSRISTMNPLTATSPSAPRAGSIRATSVTWIDDQSTAVPSARPNENAIAPSAHATAGSPRRECRTCPTGSARGTILTTNAYAATVARPIVISDGSTTPGPERNCPTSTTTPAPDRWPMLKNAWKKLITGRGRARSTCTPSAFIDTSIAPFPNPATSTAAAAAGNDRANASSRIPLASTGALTRTTARAPSESDNRPPACIDSTAAPAKQTSHTDTPPDPTPSRSRSAGRVPPNPPTSAPFIANSTVTAAAAPRVRRLIRSRQRSEFGSLGGAGVLPSVERGRLAGIVAAGVNSSCFVPEADQEFAEQPGELVALTFRQAREQFVLAGGVGLDHLVDDLEPRVGQPDQHRAPVLRIEVAGDQALRDQRVRARRDRRGADHHRRHQLPGSEPVRRAGAAQRRQHVELPRLEVPRGEGDPDPALQQPRGARDPPDHAHRADVEVGPLGPPLVGDQVHRVLRHRASPSCIPSCLPSCLTAENIRG